MATRKGVATPSVQVGFGSVWALWQGIGETKIDRYDARSNRASGSRRSRRRNPAGKPAAGAALFLSAKRVWVLDTNDELTPIDPASNRAGFPIPTRTFVGDVHEIGNGLPTILAAAGELSAAHQRDHVETDELPGRVPAGERRRDGPRIWLLNGGLRSRSLVPFDTRTGKAGAPIRLNGAPSGVWAGPGKIWVAAGPVVDEIDTAGGPPRWIRMPHGLCAFAVTGDPAGSSVWLTAVVARCGNP